jgi:hypothetical protein
MGDGGVNEPSKIIVPQQGPGLLVPNEMNPTMEQEIQRLKVELRRRALVGAGLTEVDPSVVTDRDVKHLVAAQLKRERRKATRALTRAP